MLLQDIQDAVDGAVASARRHPDAAIKSGVRDDKLVEPKGAVLEGKTLDFVKDEVALRLGLKAMKTGSAHAMPPNELARKIFAWNFAG